MVEPYALLAFSIRHRRSIPGEWQKACGLAHPTLSSARLRMGKTVPSINCMPFYSMIFNIDLDYYYYYYYYNILRVRGSRAYI